MPLLSCLINWTSFAINEFYRSSLFLQLLSFIDAQLQDEPVFLLVPFPFRKSDPLIFQKLPFLFFLSMQFWTSIILSAYHSQLSAIWWSGLVYLWITNFYSLDPQAYFCARQALFWNTETIKRDQAFRFLFCYLCLWTHSR